MTRHETRTGHKTSACPGIGRARQGTTGRVGEAAVALAEEKHVRALVGWEIYALLPF